MAVQLASQSQQPPVGSDDGFHSCGSSDEAPIDRIANHIGQLAFHDFGFPFSSTVSKAASDSGASSGGDADHTMVDTRMTDAAPGGGPQLPGAWFYEEAADGGADSADDDAYSMHGIRAALSTRNVTESVEVPSSEHVAEIVGRQGCKIKALRAKTNTYIKTPVRGEEPVFVVTGRQEDVLEAKREIECAAEHFTQIRASRRHSQGGAPAPGHVTAYVRVPLRVVGLVVGPKGATIKRIQQDTHTYIITPSREREPIFEVTGLPSNVEAARKEIEQHIYQRTGNMPITDPSTQLGSFEMPPLAPQQMAVGGQRASYGSLARQQPGQQWPRSGSVSGSGSAAGSPPAVSPQLPHMQPIGHPMAMTHYQPWSNAYHSLGIGAEMAGSELFAPRMVSGSMWGVSSQQQEMCGMTRDEGLGDSPPMAAMGDAYHLISSIWSTEHTDPLHV